MGLSITAGRPDRMFSSWKEILGILVPLAAVALAWFGNWLLELRREVRSERKARIDREEKQEEAERDALRTWTERLQQHAEEQQKRIDTLAREQHDALRKEVHDWRDNAQKLVGEIEILRKNSRDSEREMAALEERLRIKEEEQAAMRAELASKGDEIRQLREQLEEARGAADRGRLRIAELEQQMAALMGSNEIDRGMNDV